MTGAGDGVARARPIDVVRSRFDPVLVILALPRSASTALARSFWRHPSFRWYVHEPYDRVYHRGEGMDSVLSPLEEPLDVGSPSATGLVIKEMTFQVGGGVTELVSLATLPIVLCIRDPRLSMASRMLQRAAAGQAPEFPAEESGWPDLVVALGRLRTMAIPHVVVDATRLRQEPARELAALCAQLGIEFAPSMLTWTPVTDLRLGQLEGEQAHWYGRVLGSTRFEPPNEPVPALEDFPPAIRAHVIECERAYESLRTQEVNVRS